MRFTICKHLEEIEQEKGITILFAIEAGSRVWRMESKNSDYDVRFVFVRDKKDYLSLNNQPEVIEKLYRNENIDIVGFDIYKFTRLVLSSNPSMIEWLNSDIIYKDIKSTKDIFREFINNRFNPVALYHHYKSSCKNNYLKYLKSCENMTHKKYLYAMRGLINAKYVLHFDSVPHIDFNQTINDMTRTDKISKEIYDKLIEIIKLKREGNEEVKVSKLHLFEEQIEKWLDTAEDVPNRKMSGFSVLQDHIFKLVLKK